MNRSIKKKAKKIHDSIIEKQSELLIVMIDNLCKKTFKYRFIFAWSILLRINPFTNIKIKKRNK